MMVEKSQLEQLRKHIFDNILSLNDLEKIVQQKKYKRKTYLLSSGDSWNRFFYIHRGLIRLFYSDAKGREFNKAFFWEGQCILPLTPKDREQGILFNIATVENCIILECPFSPLQNLLKDTGHWEKFALPFAEKLIEQKIQREHDFLLLSAMERFEKFCTTYHPILHRLPDYHLASFLGITPVSLSRIKSLTYDNETAV